MSVIAGVDDVFFLARILEAARQVGVAVESIPAARIQQHLLQSPAQAVILDLNSASAVEVIRKVKQDPATQQVPVVGFVSHVAAEVVSAAKIAGCDVVLARNCCAGWVATASPQARCCDWPESEGACGWCPRL